MQPLREWEQESAGQKISKIPNKYWLNKILTQIHGSYLINLQDFILREQWEHEHEAWSWGHYLPYMSPEHMGTFSTLTHKSNMSTIKYSWPATDVIIDFLKKETKNKNFASSKFYSWQRMQPAEFSQAVPVQMTGWGVHVNAQSMRQQCTQTIDHLQLSLPLGWR